MRKLRKLTNLKMKNPMIKKSNMQIASKQAGLKVKSASPRFNYYFKEADEPLEVEKEHVEKILKNPNFYEFGKVKKEGKNGSKS